MKRYLMNYSQADSAWQVVYADNKREAREKYERGEFVLEDDDCE